MAGLVFEIINTVAGAVLGVVMPVVLQHALLKRRPELLGEWKSACKMPLAASDRWLAETVCIDVRWGRLRIRNVGDEPAGRYEAVGKLSQAMTVFGQRRWLGSGAFAEGHFELTVHPLGRILYGEFLCPDDTGGRVYAGWVLARTEADLEKGKRLLFKTRSYRGTPGEALVHAQA